ncbi:MAG: AraC family transcriptional regulator [Sphingobacterium sp.]|jgi:AraC-like DNA-binding protein|nr:AraC family transcriptional regulator [Sphingobacterium sp.]
MRRTVTYKFQSKASSFDITGNLPSFVQNILYYAKAEKIVFKEGVMLIQHYSHVLFYLELTTYELHADLNASYFNEKTRLFLFMMLKGNISFFAKNGLPISQAEQDICYATYNRKEEFLYFLPKGQHQFCYIMPRTAWLDTGTDQYSRLGQFLQSMKSDRTLFGHLSPCKINQSLQSLLGHIFSLKYENPIDLEFDLTKYIKATINQFQLLLDEKFSQRVYQIKEYIDQNFSSLNLDNKTLSSIFFTTEKTLIKTFRQKFGTTPHNYLTNVRMEKAKNLMIFEKIPPSRVFSFVGYSDFNSFRKQFKKYFGIPPSECF